MSGRSQEMLMSFDSSGETAVHVRLFPNTCDLFRLYRRLSRNRRRFFAAEEMSAKEDDLKALQRPSPTQHPITSGKEHDKKSPAVAARPARGQKWSHEHAAGSIEDNKHADGIRMTWHKCKFAFYTYSSRLAVESCTLTQKMIQDITVTIERR